MAPATNNKVNHTMKYRKPSTAWPFTQHLTIGLAATLALGTLSAGQALAGRSTPAIQRDFLPPVATINARLVEQVETATDDPMEPVALSAVQTPILHATPKVEKLDTDLSAQIKTTQMENLLEIQRKIDEADLESLWEATVEKNPVIRFSLEKLATPTDLQTKQSSRFMTKTLNMLISGATMVPAMLPGSGMYQNMGSMAVGNALQNMVNGKTQVNPNSLSVTEQIQLAGLIDQLKLRLIHSYQDYKNTLQNLAQSHAITAKNNLLYSKALTSKNDLAIMAAGSAYYQALLSETALRQKAKLNRLQLERLAGPEAVQRLELAVHVPENATTAMTTPSIEPNDLKEPGLQNQELIGPSPMESMLQSNTTKTSELIGPELPPAKTRAPKQNSRNNPKNNDPLQPMEIGPQLNESDAHHSLQLPQAISQLEAPSKPGDFVLQ